MAGGTSIIIPARYGSSRFPGKPLAQILGRPMIWWVWQVAVVAADMSGGEISQEDVVVATDSEEIQRYCMDNQIRTEITDIRHTSGTSRCFEVCENKRWNEDYLRQVVILQGDEPMMSPEFISRIATTSRTKGFSTATGYCSLAEEDLADRNVVKVLVDKHGRSVYFTRQSLLGAYRHLGIYLYRTPALEIITRSSPGPLEKAENLEQLRAVELGVKFHMEKWDGANYTEPVSVDVPEDVAKIEELMRPARTR